MLKVYGSELSAPANRVRFTANAVGLDHEFIHVNLREGEHRKAEFLKINPIGKVPAIDDDGFTMFESGAICKYICRKKPSNIYPEDIKQRSLIDQWSEFAVLHVLASVGRLLFNRVFAPMINIDVDERSIKDGLDFLDRYLPLIEQRLSESEFIAGDQFSLADITLISSLDPVEVAQFDISSYKTIVKYRTELKQQDWYQKCYKDYGEPLKQMTK